MVALRWTPSDGKRKRGKPKETYPRMVEGELKKMEWSWGEAEKVAEDRQKWRGVVSALCDPDREENK